MSDLSRMLSDVYGTNAEQDQPPETAEDDAGSNGEQAGTLPAWADESVLDQAFSSWVPGPPTSAPAAERSMLADLADGKADNSETEQADWLIAPEGASPQDESLAALETGTPRWTRDSDDLLPTGRRGRSFTLRR